MRPVRFTVASTIVGTGVVESSVSIQDQAVVQILFGSKSARNKAEGIWREEGELEVDRPLRARGCDVSKRPPLSRANRRLRVALPSASRLIRSGHVYFRFRLAERWGRVLREACPSPPTTTTTTTKNSSIACSESSSTSTVSKRAAFYVARHGRNCPRLELAACAGRDRSPYTTEHQRCPPSVCPDSNILSCCAHVAEAETRPWMSVTPCNQSSKRV